MNRIQILVVDDDELVLKSCARVLAEIPGAEIVQQKSGDHAARLLSTRAFDLLISDIRMPGKSGLDLLELAYRQNPGLPVILMSGYPTDEIVKGRHPLGAAAYIMKPIHPDEFLATVRRVLQQKTMAA